MRLNIAGINIDINGDINQFFIDRVQNYIADSNEKNNQIEINFAICDDIEKPNGKIIATKADRTWLYDENGDFGYFDYNDHFNKCVFTATISKRIEISPMGTEHKKHKINIKFYHYRTRE